MDKISLILSVYNEEEGILSFWETLKTELSHIPDYFFELIWVNDGSLDKSQILIEEICRSENKNIRHINIQFSRNFGHEAAMLAGIDIAEGDALICMDTDGQHPAAQIAIILNCFKLGSDIILMHRTFREDGGLIRRILSNVFYRLINILSEVKFENSASDFFLISSTVADIFKKQYRDNNRFIRGFIQEIGFKTSILNYVAPAREFGSSGYSLKKLFKLSLDVVFSFSNKPLRIAMLVSMLFLLFTLFFGTYSIVQYFIQDSIPSGYTSLIFFISLSFSILFIVLTIISLYFEKVIAEIRKRPIYIIKELKKY